jgi:dolichol kinase
MGEIRRRLVHVAGAGFPGLYLLDRELGLGIGWAGVRTLLVTATLVAAVIEGVRLSGRLPDRIEDRVFEPLVRPYERDNAAGYALFLLGATVASAFPPTAAVPAMLMLAIADPISGVLSAGSIAKRAHVVLATFGVCTLLALPFVSSIPAVAGAVTATVADGHKPVIRTYVIDDNLTIPIGAAAAITLGLHVG